MKRALLLLSMLMACLAGSAQRTIALRNLWIKPQVHVAFGDYTVSFTIKDINKALELLAQSGDMLFDTASHLDDGRDYYIELYPDIRTEYKDPLQPLMQNGAGVFLLLSGHALVENRKHKKLRNIIADKQAIGDGISESYYIFYDPRNNQRIFSGKMRKGLYGKDLGID